MAPITNHLHQLALDELAHVAAVHVTQNVQRGVHVGVELCAYVFAFQTHCGAPVSQKRKCPGQNSTRAKPATLREETNGWGDNLHPSGCLLRRITAGTLVRLAHAPQRRLNPINDSFGQRIGPLIDGLIGHTHSFCSCGYVPTKEFDGFGFVHGLALNHSSACDATTVHSNAHTLINNG